MKRITQTLIVTLLLSSMSPIASAATESCPNTWKIDNSVSGGWTELQETKRRLSSNMVLEVNEYSAIFSDYSGELGPMPKPSVNLLGVPDLYIYGNTKVAFKVTVQVKDCPGKTDFLLQGGSLKQYLGIKANPEFVQTTAKDFATNKGDSFYDFVKAQEFPACIASLTRLITTSAAKSGGVLYQAIRPGLARYKEEFCGLRTQGGINPAYPILLNLTPGCALIDEESDAIPRRLGISVAPNKSCEFAFAVSDSLFAGVEAVFSGYTREILNPIYVLESFKVSGPVTKTTTIACVKGKATKKITAVNPKCPKGYKKK